MTDQELARALAEIESRISTLGPDKGLSDQDWRLKTHLGEQRDVLQKIRQAKETPNVYREARLTAYYDLLVNPQPRNPFLYYLTKLRLKTAFWL
jgi:hypothetical protein